MVTWIRFRDLKSNREIYFVNTHFDHQVQKSREQSAQLVLKRVLDWKTNKPVILVGDFNAAAGSNQAYKILVTADGFQDAWDGAKRQGSQTQSFNGFHFPAKEEGSRIDWILYRGPLRPRTITIDPFAKDGQYPSDHFPVVAEFAYE
jgi:endonuclease/exonuclease/phosphatase family metal-dependent hydrolase